MATLTLPPQPYINEVFEIDIFDFKVKVLPERLRYAKPYEIDSKRFSIYPFNFEISFFGLHEKYRPDEDGKIDTIFMRLESDFGFKLEIKFLWQEFAEMVFLGGKGLEIRIIHQLFNDLKGYALKQHKL